MEQLMTIGHAHWAVQRGGCEGRGKICVCVGGGVRVCEWVCVCVVERVDYYIPI